MGWARPPKIRTTGEGDQSLSSPRKYATADTPLIFLDPRNSNYWGSVPIFWKRNIWGHPLIKYAPKGRGGVKSPIHFHCVLHAKKGGKGDRIACT